MDARDQHRVNHRDAERFTEGAQHKGCYSVRRRADLGKARPNAHPFKALPLSVPLQLSDSAAWRVAQVCSAEFSYSGVQAHPLD